MDELSQRIETLMNERQYFRSPDITVRDVANELATNRLYISHAINQTFGMSFIQYTNKKRIEYAISLMKKYPNMPLEDVALDSGFVSEKAFFRKFKEVMDDTPRAYMKKNQ